MHAKEEGIIRALKEISKTENEVAKKAIANNHMDVATHTLIVARVTAEAAEIIAKQDAELAVLRTQPVTGLDLSNTGRLIYTIGSELQRYTIIAGFPEDAVTFIGASIGFMGAEKVRDKVIAAFNRRVKEKDE
ncbi:Prophage protein [Escherichia coli]|nr:Prophage protein [Escherichia coli]